MSDWPGEDEHGFVDGDYRDDFDYLDDDDGDDGDDLYPFRCLECDGRTDWICPRCGTCGDCCECEEV